MSRLGMDFGFGFEHVSPDDRLRAIRDVGFDDIMLWWGLEYAEVNGTPQQLFDRASAIGLGVRTAHFPTGHTPDCWREGPAGDAYEQALIAALQDCGERGIAHLVVHTTKSLITPPPNKIGLHHFRRALEAAEKWQVNLAFENTRFPYYNAYLYEHLSSDWLAFCFDSGHAHCFTPDLDPLDMFSSRLVTMHLHDNHGAQSGDEHLIPGMGTVDFSALMPRLAALSPQCYNLECRVSKQELAQGMTMTKYLIKSRNALDELLKMCSSAR